MSPVHPAPIPPLLPPPAFVAIEEAAERIRRHLLVVQALEYVRCRRAGGSIEECLLGYSPKPPLPEDPFFQELLSSIDPQDSRALLQTSKDLLTEQLEVVQGHLDQLGPQRAKKR